MKTVTSIAELIETLGGPKKAAEAMGASSEQMVANWRLRNKISPRHFIQHQEALKRQQITAPPSLWFGAPQ